MMISFHRQAARRLELRAIVAGAGLLLAAMVPGCSGTGRNPEMPPNPALEGVYRAADGVIVALRPPTDGLTVLFFYSQDCPISNFYIPVLNALVQRHGEDRIRWVGACVDPQPDDQLKHARDYAISFPVIADRRGQLARAVGATTTPEALVFDARGQLLYRGRIDDHYAARGVKAAAPQSHDLDDAVTAGLAGRRPDRREASPVGCPLPESVPEEELNVTYAEHVAPLLFKWCLECHREGAIAPFPLETYEQARQRAGDLATVTRSRFMPPSRRDPRFGQRILHDRLLADSEIDLIATWAAQGGAEGDPSLIPEKPQFTAGWALGTPDLVLEMPEPFVVPATGSDILRCFVLPTGLRTDEFVSGIEFQPGSPRAVHHIISYVDTSGAAAKLDDRDPGPGYECFGGPRAVISGDLGGWGPGSPPDFLPEGIARRLPANADIIMQIHYHPTGREESDRTRIGIYFSKLPVKQAFHWMLTLNDQFRIPPGARNYEVTASRVIPVDVMVSMVAPHMHLLGKDVRIWVEKPDGTRVDLLRVAPWDFAWQRLYYLEKPVSVPRGSTIRLQGHFDNSSDNPLNPSRESPIEVRPGEQTTDEMILCAIGVTKTGQDLTQPGAKDDLDDFLNDWDLTAKPTWRVWSAAKDGAATLQPTTEGFRLALSHASAQAKQWEVQVKHPAEIQKGISYELTIRLKADAPREVGCSILQNHKPYEHLCERETFHLSTEWQTFRKTFTADRDELDAQIMIAAGASSVSMDIGETTLSIKADDGP